MTESDITEKNDPLIDPETGEIIEGEQAAASDAPPLTFEEQIAMHAELEGLTEQYVQAGTASRAFTQQQDALKPRIMELIYKLGGKVKFPGLASVTYYKGSTKTEYDPAKLSRLITELLSTKDPRLVQVANRIGACAKISNTRSYFKVNALKPEG